MQDLCFSAQSGNSLFPDPGVNAGSFTVPDHFPDPELFLEFLSSYSDCFILMLRVLLQFFCKVRNNGVCIRRRG